MGARRRGAAKNWLRPKVVLACAPQPGDLAAFARCGLIGYEDIFTHQRDALEHSLAGRNVAVTAGTGSGKTESFLLPIVSSLVSESAAWTGTSPPGSRWWEVGSGWTPQPLNCSST